MNYLKIFMFLSIISAIFADCVYNNKPCDFDLENIDKMIDQLPEACQKIWSKRENDCKNIYNKALAESNLYKSIIKKLNDMEKKGNHNPEKEGIPEKNWTYRTKLYTNAKLYECTDQKMYTTSDEYYDCLIEKRSKMLAELNKFKQIDSNETN